MVDSYPFAAETFVLVGRVSKTHGLKGELKIVVYSGRPEDLKKYSRVALVANDGRMTALLDIVRARLQGRQIILKLDTIDSKNEADLTIGMGVLLARADLADEDWPDQLQAHRGKTVKTLAGNCPVGVVQGCFHNGAYPVLVIQDGEDEILMPLIDEFVIHISDREITINPPPGLLDLNSAGNQ